MPCNVYVSVCSRGEGRLDSRIGLPVWFVHRGAKEAALTVPRQVDQALVFVRVEAHPGTQGDQRNQHPSCWGASCTEEVSFELSPAGKQSPVPPCSGCAGHMAAAWSLGDSRLWVCRLRVMLKGMVPSDCPPAVNLLDLFTGAWRAMLSRIFRHGQVLGREWYVW